MIPIVLIVASSFVALLVIGIIFSKMYRRSSKERSFVRTGMGGQKVVMNGGAMVFPVLHEIIWVNMNTLKLAVRRENQDGLITKDRMRVDVTAEFYLRVKPETASIANAAQTLGQRTMNPEKLRDLVEGKFVDALRSVAAQMGMQDLHEQRTEFVDKVQQAVAVDLEKNGLELESVSLTGLDQTSKEFFNENNAFDAEGLKALTETIETRKKERNDIEKDNEVLIAQKNLQAEKIKLGVIKDEEFAKAEQFRQVEIQKSIEQTETAKQKASNDRDAKSAQIEADQQVKSKQIIADQKVEQETIKKDQSIKQADIEKEKSVEIANQERNIAVAKKSEEQSVAQAEAERARADAVKALEEVATAKATEVANREKAIAVIKAEEEAQEKAVGIKIAASAEKEAAKDKADAIKLEATGKADAITIEADANERKYEVDAEGKEKLNEAENKLDPAIIRMRIQLETIQQASAIIAASVKPMESIEGIKIINVGGLSNLTGGNSNGNGSAGSGNMAEDLVNGLLKYRAASPLVDHILKEVGIDASSIKGLTNIGTNISLDKSSAKDVAKEIVSNLETTDEEERAKLQAELEEPKC